jgi:hypothetical protein
MVADILETFQFRKMKYPLEIHQGGNIPDFYYHVNNVDFDLYAMEKKS